MVFLIEDDREILAGMESASLRDLIDFQIVLLEQPHRFLQPQLQQRLRQRLTVFFFQQLA